MTHVTTDEVLASLGIKPFHEKAPVNDPSKLGMEDFLTLMITELNDQDPFEPMDNTQMIAQMAQFASVSGLDQLNKSFAELSANLTSDQALQAGALVGRQVLVPTDIGYLGTGGAIKGQVELEQSAEVTLRVTDATGQLVRELPLGMQQGDVHFAWDGITDSGAYASPGIYWIEVDARYGRETAVLQPQIMAPVASVGTGADGKGLVLNLEGLGPVEFNQVTQIY
ncbi:MAG: flagellar hook assembly protein FlgD [Candidatus Sedimenticola endophacoides]